MQYFQRFAVLLAVAAACGQALAGAPVPLLPGTNLDNSDADETEYSAIRQEFVAPASGGRIEFDWQVFTSEFFGGGAEDVFYVRLINPANNAVVDAEDWALDPTPAGYMGTFTPVGQPPVGTTASSQAVAGGVGLMYDAFHIDGGSGWASAFLSFPPATSDYPLAIEILVADTVDRNADTTLAIDNIRARDVTGALIPSLVNPSFESLLAGWTVEGNAGVQATMIDLFTNSMPVAGTQATAGKMYAVVSTGGQVPEPAAVWLAAAFGLGGTMMVRRGAMRS